MRGSIDRQMTMCTVIDPGELIPEQHPIRRVRPFVESALSRLEPTFEAMYAKVGRLKGGNKPSASQAALA